MSEFHSISRIHSAASDSRLLVLLHGYGSHENDLPGLADELQGQVNYISLRAPLSLPWGGYAWFPIYPAANGFTSDVQAARLVIQDLHQWMLQTLAQYQPADGKLWLLGFSQGSILSQALMMRFPELVGGVMGLSGYLNQEMLEDLSGQPSAVNCALFLAHGTEDGVIPIHKARETHLFYQSLGMAHEYREYAMGHSVSGEEMLDLQNWWKDHRPTI